MARAPFQVLVLPYRRSGSGILFAVFHRHRPAMWQFVAGGGEDEEKPLEAAVRELDEETGLSGEFLALDSMTTVPRDSFATATWGPEVHVVPEYAFAVQVEAVAQVTLSHEHDEFEWCSYERARELLKWDSNRTALWELRRRLQAE